ncbi:MAG: alpha/beta hydrolase [Bacteroidota bacterium]|nr:alpha/beta hydrolase [Bacteroidota bacterium]
MIKLIILLLLLLFSLLTIFRAPTNLLWYLSILVTEFSWVFIVLILLLFFWPAMPPQYAKANMLVGIAAIAFFSLPTLQGWWLSRQLESKFNAAFDIGNVTTKKLSFNPFHFLTGINKPKIPHKSFVYDAVHALSLDFYAAQLPGMRPCVVVIHGGSWAAGDSRQLPELNWELARAGYHVASINYRLAPVHRYPAPLQDVQAALRYLQQKAAELSLDKNRFVLLGRSAGGQIALSAAYTLYDPTIKAVIDFYGPTDMVWGYENPTNPLVLDSRKIMEDYLGGTLKLKPEQYIHSSATETVTSKAPPTLMIYAENDPLVSPRHGTRLSVKLKAIGIPHFELYLPWATHGFDYTLNGPGGQLSTWTVNAFLEWVFNDDL